MSKLPPEERALLSAIIADPDDGTLRLAYADWLDEHADSLPKARRETAGLKAEHIRLQIEEAGLVFGAPGFDERYDAIQAREFALLDSGGYYKACVAELDGVTPARGLHFYYRRGLFGEVACTAKYFVEHGAALLDAAPITAVRLKKLTGSNVKRLTTCPHFARVRCLKVYAADTPHDAVFALLERAPLGHLRTLVLDNWLANHGGEADADPLAGRVAGCEKLGGLKRLSFYAAGIGAAGGRALAESPHLNNLEALDLRVNGQLGAAVAALRGRFGKRVWLDYGDLKGRAIGEQDMD